MAKRSHSITFGTLEKCESRFSPYRADGTQHAQRRVGERFADVSDVDGKVQGGGGVMVERLFVMHNVHKCILLMAFRDTVSMCFEMQRFKLSF